MTEQSADCRRDGTLQLLDRMIIEREEMLRLMCKVSGRDLSGVSAGGSVHADLQEFCQILVDYIATSHFGLYERIAEGKERRQAVLDVARTVYQTIDESTQIAVDFNDKYETVNSETGPHPDLQDDLTVLGEKLANRIEYEDQLIDAMRA